MDLRQRTRLHLIVPLIAGASLLLSASAWAKDVSTFDRFELWNDCEPMDLIVERFSQDATEIGLTEEAVTSAVRSRLRAARLFDADNTSYLYANVFVVGPAFSVRVSYYKLMRDFASGEISTVSAWGTASTGTHGRDSGFILSSVSEHTDRFLDEYLRVNEVACTR